MTKEEIKEIRELYGLSQTQWARKLGVTVQTISNWENGRSQPSELAQNYLKELKEKISNE